MRVRGLLVDITPLRESRDFRLIWLAQLATTAGRQVVLVAVPYQVYLLTHSSFAVGLIGLFQAVPIILTALYAGALADRMDRRQLQLLGKAVGAATSVGLMLGAIGLRGPLWSIFGLTALSAAAMVLDQSARSATVPRLVPRNQVSAATSLSEVLFQTGSVVGPAVAGLILARAGLPWAYAFDVVCFVPASFLIWSMTAQPQLGGQRAALGLRAPVEAFRDVMANRMLVGIFSADLIAMIFGMPTAVFPALAITVLGTGAVGLGVLYAAPAAGALAASLLSGWVRRVGRHGSAVVIAIVVWGLAIALFGVTLHWLWLALLLLALAGAADTISAIFRSTILQLAVPDHMRGRMSAFSMMVVTAGPRLGDVEAGGVAALVNPVFSVVSGGLACVVGIVLLAGLVPEMWRYRA